ncbi:MAG: leucine-rich repeat protein [Eubacterium sp.]|nr:leucine-rich repeat protein [Eubacterium sp.]
MKKALSIILSICMLLSITAGLNLTAFADVEGDFEYSVSDNKATITKYTGSATELEIPSTLGGFSVTSIGVSAFDGRTGLISIEIPNSITRIDYTAFWGCTSLEKISVDSNNAAYDSRNNCNAIIETSTNTLVMGCKNTIIPNSVTSIFYDAFWGCTGLTSIEIPDSVTSIEYGAFGNCKNLTSIIVDSNNAVYDCRENCNAIIETATNTLIVGCTSTIIPNSVTSIGKEAFECCSSLTSIEIPNSVTSIGYEAFSECSGLTNLKIPNSVTSIEYGAFKDCTGLTSVEFPDGITSIGSWAFYGCTGLTNLKIPNSVISIENGAFGECTGLTNIEISNSVINISEFVFAGCTGLTSIKIPDSVTSIGEYAFSYCIGLTSITIPNSVTSIGQCVFERCTSFTDVYYIGTIEQWKAISIDDDNYELEKATIHCTDGVINRKEKSTPTPTPTPQLTPTPTPAPASTPAVTTKTTVALKKVTVKKSAKKLVLQATVKVDGKAVKGKKVTFKFNGKKYTAKTNKKGIAKVTVKKAVLKKLKAGKKIKITATCNKVTAKRTVKVKK